MNFPICNHTAIYLAARTEMTEQQAAKLWCVKSGAIRIDTLAPEATTAKPGFLRLALKGDLIGVERLAAMPEQLRLTAITPSCLSPVNLADEQQWQQNGSGLKWRDHQTHQRHTDSTQRSACSPLGKAIHQYGEADGSDLDQA